MTDTLAHTRAPDPLADVDAERSVLGSMMCHRAAAAEVFGILRPSDYYLLPHTTIHEALADLDARDHSLDPISVAAELERRGQLGRVGGRDYLHELVSRAIPGSVGWHAELVREKAQNRRLAETLSIGQDALREGTLSASEIAALLEERFTSDPGQHDDDGAIGATLGRYEADLLDLQQHGPRQGVRTGFADLDALTNGLQPGQLIITAGRPAMGKSVFGLDVARQAAVLDQRPVALYSLEMSRQELTNRLVSSLGRIPHHHLGRQGGMGPGDWERLRAALQQLQHAPLTLRTDPGRTVADIHADARRLKRAAGLDLVVVDYLQLLQPSGVPRRAENRQVEVAAMSRQLKLMAKDLDVPVLVLAQLNRGPEQRQDKRPILADLRESGALEQDSDVVILLHREDAYDKDTARAGEADLIVAKHRNGPTAEITVAAQLHYARFTDMSPT